MTEQLPPMDEVARRVAAGETKPSAESEPPESSPDSEPPESEAPPESDEAPRANGNGAAEAAPDPEPEPEPEEEPPAPARRSRAGARTAKKPAPRRSKAVKPKDDPPPPTPIADVGIAEHPDPTAPFPAQREAAPDPPPLEPAPPAPPAARPPAPPVRVYTAQDDVPADESDPLMRDGVTYDEIQPAEGMQFPDQSGGGRKAPSNLTDICRDYKIGASDSDCYVRVERKKPTSWQGISCAGFLGNIRGPLSEGEFKAMVGGGTYELVVYGPDPRGTSNPFSGTHEVKALTKPITVHHPGRPLFVNLDSFFGEGDDMAGGGYGGWDPGAGRRAPGRGEVTSADAKIHQDSLTFAQRELEAQRRENKELRDARKDDGTTPAVVRAIENSARAGVDAVRQTSETTQQLMERQLSEKERQLEEMRQEIRQMRDQQQNRPAADEHAWGAFARMSEAALQGRNSGSDAGELSRVHEQHKNEMDRIHSAHTREMDAQRARYEEAARVKDGEMERTRTMYAEREREHRTEAERREKSVKEEADRREKQLEERYKDRIESMKTDHERELKAQQRQEELIRETHKTSFETRISAAEERARIAKEEATRAREDAENKEDFFSQMEKVQSQAELLGFTKSGDDNPPSSWQERIAAAVGNALESAPAIFDAATKTFVARQDAIQSSVQAMRLAQQPPRALPQRPPQPQVRPGAAPAQRRFWATEEGVPIQSTARPPEADVRPDQVPPPIGGEGAAQAAAQQLPAQPQPPAQPPTPPPQGMPAGTNGASQLPPGMLNQLRLMLEGSYGEGIQPHDFAMAFAQQIGVDQLRLVIGGMTADNVLETLSEDPQGASSVLLGREGRTWFRAVWNEGAQIVSQAQ